MSIHLKEENNIVHKCLDHKISWNKKYLTRFIASIRCLDIWDFYNKKILV